MSEEFLDFADVGAAAQEMGGKRMPENVRRDGGLDPRLPGALMHDGIDHGLSETVSKVIEKERVLTRALDQLGSSLSQVVVEHERGAAGQRDNAILPALAVADQKKALAKIHIGEINATALGETHSRPVEQLEDGSIASAVDGASKRRLDQPRHVALRQHESRQRQDSRESHRVGGILKHVTALHEISKEPPHRGQIGSLRVRHQVVEASQKTQDVILPDGSQVGDSFPSQVREKHRSDSLPLLLSRLRPAPRLEVLDMTGKQGARFGGHP